MDSDVHGGRRLWRMAVTTNGRKLELMDKFVRMAAAATKLAASMADARYSGWPPQRMRIATFTTGGYHGE
jgi:hypothetical protein